jgi:PPM family protein phosphatase
MSIADAIEIVGHSDPGMVRSHNEDSIANDARFGLAILADGMGGYNAGEVASGMATTVLMTELQGALSHTSPFEPDESGVEARTAAARMLREQINKANTAIFSASQSQPQYAGMGTTLVMAVFYDNKMTVAHIGDSRLYRFREGKFSQVTRDHSLLQEQIDSGMITEEEAKHSQNKNLVTRALGIDPTVEAEVHDYETQPGDIYLLCSDGLSDMVEDPEIGLALESLGGNLNLAAQQLVQMANDNGGRDNVSVLLVKILKEYPAAKGLFGKFLGWFK